jgi:UDP-3-O-[3-hydroxymyristoyl] glucosamine N-acyltransferase
MSKTSAHDKEATPDRSRKSRLIICTVDVNSFFCNFFYKLYSPVIHQRTLKEAVTRPSATATGVGIGVGVSVGVGVGVSVGVGVGVGVGVWVGVGVAVGVGVGVGAGLTLTPRCHSTVRLEMPFRYRSCLST